jgi:hypothetical protein
MLIKKIYKEMDNLKDNNNRRWEPEEHIGFNFFLLNVFLNGV